jgi:hypothetical protein
MDKLVRETTPEIGVVSFNYHSNGEVGLMAVRTGLHVVLKLPSPTNSAKLMPSSSIQ